MSVDDIIDLGNFLKDFNIKNQITFGSDFLNKGLKVFQNYCKSHSGTWICDCENKTVSVCCGGLDSNHWKTDIDSFNPYKIPICNNCTTLGNLEV